MKKRTKRILAMLLASAMILQQGSTVGVLATETEPVSETVAETTAAETMAQETQAPETTAETKAPETQATETALGTTQTETAATEQTETAVPQTEQTETPAATEATEATETAAETTGSTEQSETTSQETTAQETTETPAQTEEKTEAAEETATEKATEAATETEAPKTNFTYEDSRVIITAVAEAAANLPQDAQIHADYMAPGTAAYNEAAAALEAAYAGQDVVLDYVFYDIYFTAASAGDGRIEPEAGTVTVSMQFKKAELTPDKDVEVQSYDVVHVENGKAQEVPSTVHTTGDGSVASVGFTSDSFSPYGFVTVGQEPVKTIGLDEEYGIMPVATSVFDGKTYLNITESNGSVDTTITTNGQGVTDLYSGSAYRLDLNIFFPTVNPNQAYYIDLESLSSYLALDTSGIPVDAADASEIAGLGHYYLDVENKRLCFIFDETNSAARNVRTHIFLEASASKEDIQEGDKVEFKIGEETFEFQWHGKQSQLKIEKSDGGTYNSETGTVQFTVKATSEFGANEIRSLTDTFSMLSLADDFTVQVVKHPGDVSLTADTVWTDTSFTTTLNPPCSLNADEYLTFTYSMKIDDSKAVDGLNIVENKATVAFKDNWDRDRNSDEAKWSEELEVTRPSVKKEYIEVGSDPTKQLKWSIVAKKGEAGLDKEKVVLEDSWNSLGLVLTEELFKESSVAIKYKDGTKNVTGNDILSAVIFAAQGFKINFEEVAKKLGISDIEEFELTYTTNVDVDKAGLDPGQKPDVTNTVTVEKDGTKTDTDYATGQIENNSELGIAVSKSHESISDAEGQPGIKKVDWTSTLTIKPGDYKKLYVTDKLELAPSNIDSCVWGWFDVSTVSTGVGAANVKSNSIITSIEFSPDVEEKYFSNMKLVPKEMTWTDKPEHKEVWQGFELTLLDSTENIHIDEEVTITLKYVSYYDGETSKKASQGQGTIKNTINFYNNTAFVNASDTISEGFVKGAVTKAIYNARVNQVEGSISWQVTVKYDALKALYYNEATMQWSWPKTAKFVDTIPENMKLADTNITVDGGVQKSKVGYGVGTNINPDYTTPVDDKYINLNGRILTVDILDILKKFYGSEMKTDDLTFVYHTKIADYEKYLKDGVKDYTNSVSLYLGDRLPDTAKVTQTMNPGGEFSKKGEVSGNTATFTVSKFGAMVSGVLATHPDEYKEAVFVDEYGYALRYDDSIFNAKLNDITIEKNTGSGLYYTVDEDRHVIEFHIPVENITNDSTLTYSLKLVPTAEEKGGGTNTIWLRGYEKTAGQTDIKTSATGAFGEYDATYLSVYKTGEYIGADGTPQTEPLSQVKFALHKASYDSATETFSYESEVLDSVTTLADGRASFDEMIQANELYAIVETSTPAGYKAADPIYVMCYYKDAESGVPTEDEIKTYKEKNVQIKEINEGGITAFTVEVVNKTGAVDAELSLSGTKTLDGVAPKTAGKFSFKVEDATDYTVDGAPEKEAELPKGTITDGAGGAINISGIKFSAAGTYKLKVSEVAGTDTSIKYDSKTYTVEVKVELNSDDTAYVVTEVKVNSSLVNIVDGAYPLTETGTATFANITKTDATLALSGTKTLDSVAPATAGNFSFKIEDATDYTVDGAPEKEAELPKGTITDGAGGAINISGIKFSVAGTYKLKVSEVAGTDTSIKYDSKTYTVEVKVESNSSETGYEVTEVKVGVGAAAPTKVDAVNNVYPLTPGATTFANTTKTYTDATLALNGTKTLDGAAPKTAGSFTFKVEDVTDYKASGAPEETAERPKGTITDGAGGAINISGIRFSAAGTYKLKVFEVAGTDTTIKYDSKTYTVEVTVTLDKTAASYKVTEVKVGVGAAEPTPVNAVNNVYPLTKAGTATFANTTKTYTDATLALSGTKTLNGAAPEADAFAFKAEATGTNKTDVTITPATVKNGADGSFTFSSIKFAKAGTYTLEISEIPDNVGTVTYDKTSYIVTVTVKSTESGFEVESVKVGEENLSLVDSKYVLPKQKDAQEKETATFVNSTLVKLDKVDENNKKVIGAELQVVGKDADGKDVIIEGWTTNSDLHVITGKLELGKTYILKEVSAPKGYKLADPVEFKVGEDGKIYLQGKAEPVEVITMTDAKLHFNVNKTELGTGDEVEGAELTVYEKQADGSWKEVEGASWTSKKGETHDFGDKLEAGKSYKLVEKVAPEGYAYTTDIEFSVGTDGTITTSAKKTSDAQGNDTYLVEDAKLHFNVNKTELGTGDEVEGAELTVYEKQADGTLKKVEGASWTSKKGETHDFGEKLEAGKTYVLREEVAPDGYGYVTDIEFTVEKDGKITTTMPKTKDAAGNDTYLVEDARIRLEVDKRATGTGEELDGAVLELLDAAGNVVESWTSKKGETHNFGGKLKAGESYTLRETIAPDGYTCVTDMKFTVGKDGTVNGLDSIKTTDANGNTVYVVEDTLNKISIQKVDESGAALAGAKLVIKDADGKAVASWTTDGKAHEITGLATGKYTLSEVEAPEGYQVSKDVPFEITGKEAVGGVIELSMTDTKIPESNKYSLTVTKHLHLDGITGDLAAKEATYYVALFSDEAKTQRVSNVKKIEFKNATSSTVTFDKLAAGTYYVGETDENGTLLVSKIVNDKLIFHPEYTDGGKVELEGKKTEGTAEFTNVYMELPSGFYLSGQITVTKKVLVNGAEGTSDETYYARVFSDKKLSTPASDVLALDLAGGTSASVTVTDLPIGESIDSSMNYYVAETDENGKPLDPDAVTEFEISIDKSEVVLSANNSAQEVVITNNFVEEETETETETETEVEKKEAPKTGDDTDFMRYLLLMALSAGTCAIAFEEKRRRNRARK